MNAKNTEILEQAGSLLSTFSLKSRDGIKVPFQNNIPYPSFEPQPRQVISLEGVWKKKRFQANHNWSMTKRDQEWIARTENESEGITHIQFLDYDWETQYIPLPENIMTGKEEVNGAETYQNGVWYRKTFSFDNVPSKKVMTLKCLGLSYIGDFWLNGEYVGYHEGGYTPFAFDVTDLLQKGENTLVVRVDNPPWTSRKDIVPAVDNDFFNYTGILQDIYIEVTNSVHIVRVDVITKDLSGNFEVKAVLENRTKSDQDITFSAEMFETDPTNENWLLAPDAMSIIHKKVEIDGVEANSFTLEPGEVKVVKLLAFLDNPKLWSVRQPNLYVFKGSIQQCEEEVDAFFTQFGFRTLKTEKAHIFLNEQPIFLAGVARHEDWPTYGRTASWERIKEDFLIINDLAVNMVRTAHYPNHIYTFIMLDRLGLTAMSEIPLWQFETEHYLIQEERKISYQMWREMVFSHYNRPSIIMWSTQNESKDITLRKKYNEKLVFELRESYPDGRLVTQSAAADQPGYFDESMEPLDVMGWTMYFGIFHGSTPYEGTRDFIEKAHEKWPEKPIINTEYGIWSNADKSFLEKQVEIYSDVQLALLEKATVSPQGMVNQSGYLAGIDYWTAFDWYVNHNLFYQTMGMYHMDRQTKKPLYYRFVVDHQRIMGLTNGLGVQGLPGKEALLAVSEKLILSNRTILFLTKEVNLQPYNYLVLAVKDEDLEEGLNIVLKHASGKTTAYQTFQIKKGQLFTVHVPLWQLDTKVLSNVTEIHVHYQDGRKIEIVDLTANVHGK